MSAIFKGALMVGASLGAISRGAPFSAALRGSAAVVNLILNGTFDTNTAGWAGNGSTLTVVAGRLRVTGTARTTQAFSTAIGSTYSVTGDIIAGTGTGATISAANATSGGALAGTAGGAGLGQTFTFTATATTTYVRLFPGSTAGNYTDFDNLSVVAV